MNSAISDAELGKMLRTKASALGYSPDALLDLAAAAADWNRWVVMTNSAALPQTVLEEEIGPEHLIYWPEWSAKLISPGSHVEQLHWSDGTIVTRLLNPRKLVLGASIEHANTSR